ncbi:Uncharacterised protein [Mycobacteroides abscessus subsp. abscessus]|nr:Uncharacterised protein [Mycobacteroides abscessus subsp. abscessus]
MRIAARRSICQAVPATGIFFARTFRASFQLSIWTSSFSFSTTMSTMVLTNFLICSTNTSRQSLMTFVSGASASSALLSFLAYSSNAWADLPSQCDLD